jgi:hypothetical protein
MIISPCFLLFSKASGMINIIPIFLNIKTRPLENKYCNCRGVCHVGI